jgi:3-hydroxybutyryl-CoA dehydratase
MNAPLQDLKIGSIVAEAAYGPIDREQLRDYAEASGDTNPLHLDTAFAQRAGFDDVIVHGMLGMALLGRLVSEQLPSFRIRRLRTRFRTVIALGQSIACTATVTGFADQGAEIELVARDAEGTVLLDGSALLAMPVDAE